MQAKIWVYKQKLQTMNQKEEACCKRVIQMETNLNSKDCNQRLGLSKCYHLKLSIDLDTEY